MTHPSAPSADSLRIDPARSVVLVVDIQDRLAAAMPEDDMAGLERYVGVLCELARRFRIPVVASEQYPRGLGATIAPIQAAIEAVGDGVHRLEKVDFSVCSAPEFAPVWDALSGRDQWIVTGMETHVCVYQSVRELVDRGVSVHVARDAVTSRTPANRDVGFKLIERAGGIVTSTEVVVFDVLRRAGSDDFKAMSKLIR